MVGWMNEESLRRTLETGRTWFWSRSRQEYWCKGETSGDRQYVREAYYDCDMDVLLFVVEQEGAGACHTGERSCFFRAFGGGADTRAPCERRRAVPLVPSRDEFLRARARLHRRPGVARGARRPRDAGVGVREARRRRRRASCSSRSSTPSAGAGSRSSAAIRRSRSSCAGRRVECVGGAAPDGVPTDRRRARRARGAARGATARRASPSSRRSTAASSATSATTSCARSSTCPTSRPTTSGCPTRCCSLTGHVTAFDHFRQRLYLIENVFPPPGCRRRDARRAVRRRGRAARRRASTSSAARCRTCRRRRRPTSSPSCPRSARRSAGELYRRRSRRRRSTSSPATSSRSCSRSASTSTSRSTRSTSTGCCAWSTRRRTCTSCATPRRRSSGSSPEPMVQLLDGRVISRPIAGTRRRGRTEEHDRRMAAELIEHPKERAEHVMLVDLARNDVGRVVRFGTEQVEELMTLERYSHVMHLTSQVAGDLADGTQPGRRAARDVPGRHGQRRAEGARDGDHRRARAGQARAVRGRRRLRRLLGQPRHRDRDPHDGLARRPGERAGRRRRSSPTPIPADEDLECHNKARALLTAAAAARHLASLSPVRR